MPTPGINAGTLDKRVTLLAPVYNEFQDEITAWQSVTDVWAAISPNFGREDSEAARTVSNTQVPIVIRYRSDIDQRWRIQDREHVYAILGMVDVGRRRVQLQLNCEEVR